MQNITAELAGHYKAMRAGYAYYIERADTRVADWPLMGSPLGTILLDIAYLIVVIGGMSFMRDRKPFSLKPVVAMHNFLLVAVSGYMVWEMFRSSVLEYGYKLCDPVDYSPKTVDLAKVLWIFYYSKVVEFFDTILMVLRKKNDQVSFLHVYHHVSVFALWWIGVKWVAGGSAYFSSMQNSFVHFWMYGYYLFATYGIQVPWKRHITKMQMAQFLINSAHSMYGLWIDCPFPRWMHWGMLIYMASLFTLFLNFYIQAYIKGRRDPKRLAASQAKKNN
eukprot:TRINITY_DN2342_c0_g1_i1.p1 TRINITY_DN2342_c0_g1~~TRINITY_DN2342_c0_g1_i1.p1  ORF type:complete len:277 (-),score=42.86 TRINITY_DN2342_c0_g1_i1:162-992(-)